MDAAIGTYRCQSGRTEWRRLRMSGLEQNLLFAVVGLTMTTTLVIVIVQMVRRRRDDDRGGNPWDDLEQ